MERQNLTDARELLEQAGHILETIQVALGCESIAKEPGSTGAYLILNDVRLRVERAGLLIDQCRFVAKLSK
ncbi:MULTISPECIES: hypothetical protein [Methylocaldum]|jgi:hypothetical protein|uniref:hypothetical protein n=1 Tax=Methylocaldum sp. 14B TaxID=1912213 RepID=UPI00098AF21E|nr:hypothetical protein [Methylocaldum sp. 14B]